MNKSMMKEEVTKHLTENIIPFWKALRTILTVDIMDIWTTI